MSNCLGLYIEEHLIKYAKVSKERDNVKVESFGVKFYENLGDAISQIVEETDSQKSLISVNLSNEMYNYFDMFALLSKKDLQKAIKTEFDSYCVEKGENANLFETRYAITEDRMDNEKLRVIHVAASNMSIDKIIREMGNFKATSLVPLPMAIPVLMDRDEGKNCLVVNIEEDTTITTILNGQVYNIDKFEMGSEEILARINMSENSYSKSYEICKNTTIYTSEGNNLVEDSNVYVDQIMPTLYEVIGNVRKVINSSVENIEKVYITGTAALINNIDLYFQEYLAEVECEILRPFFVENTKDLSIKDYIEVNSAIALAMMGLGEGVDGVNFSNQKKSTGLADLLTMEIGPKKGGSPKPKKSKSGAGKMPVNFSWDLGQRLDAAETNLARISAGLIILVVVYSGFSYAIGRKIEKKEEEVQASITKTQSQIQLAKSDSEKIEAKANEYTRLINNLQEINDRITDINRTKKAIPNLLNEIMTEIPVQVQIVSITNTNDTHIVIEAKSEKYEQLGFFKASLKTKSILENVTSTSGKKEGKYVNVRIEGDLPKNQ